MDKSGKVYVKAMNKYNDGYIDRALALCEKSISINIGNAAALNLKGILHYLKGDLESAKKMWNINYKRNNDEVSKKYLRDSIRDKEKLQIYLNALELIKELNISGALQILKQCESSHFNFINVTNQIGICYIKQGEYDKALQCINEVLKVDKKNAQATLSKRTLVEYGNLKRDINFKKIFMFSASISLAIIILLLGKTYIYKAGNFSIATIKKIQSGTSLINNKDKELAINSAKTESQNTKEIEKKENEKNTKVQSRAKNQIKSVEDKLKDTLKFPNQEFSESITNNNMEQIVGFVSQWNGADLEINDKLLVAKGQEIIKGNGIVYFYEKGISYMNDKKFGDAEEYFLYALPYSNGNYLRQHIIYMLALSYKNTSDFKNAVKYYELTLKEFPSGSYTEEILYNLILINKDVERSKAKEYAEKLVGNFPESQYTNTVVKDILQ
jgi:tetratricopeptide (TPR) repeat protein